MRFRKLIPIILVISTFTLLLDVHFTFAAETTLIHTSPRISSAPPRSTFNMEVKIDNVQYLYAWQFNLTWNKDVLNVTSVHEGVFLNAEKTHKTFIVKKIYNDKGYSYIACTIYGEQTSASGSGTLVQITFFVKSEGKTELTLQSTKLIKQDQSEIDHETQDGLFQYPPPTVIHVNPQKIFNTTLTPASRFNVSVDVQNVENLQSWDINLTWNKDVLNVTSVHEGTFLSEKGETNFAKILEHDANGIQTGILLVNCSLLNKTESNSGNGTLFSICFTVKKFDLTSIRIEKSVLLSTIQNEIVHISENGYFYNILHDVAVVSINASKLEATSGESLTFTVTVKNKGNRPENFTVLLLANENLIEHQTVQNLDPNKSEHLNFTWETKGIEGVYWIKAIAEILCGEFDDSNNIKVMAGQLTVGALGTPNIYLITTIVLIIFLAVLTVMYLMKRKKNI